MQTSSLKKTKSALPAFELPDLTKAQQKRLLATALTTLEMQQQMTTKRGKNLLHYTLKRKRQHLKMQHYPKGDRIDYTTGAQYFYHCHREDEISQEHGHFHLFLRQKGIPKSITPTPLPDWDINMDNPMAHLVAIGINRYGQPIRMFTVNRWVSYETWYDAKHAPAFLKRFKFTLDDDPYWQVLDAWVEGMAQLFAPQIKWLLEQRDVTIAARQTKYPAKNAYQDHKLEELSEISIDLASQIEWIAQPR